MLPELSLGDERRAVRRSAPGRPGPASSCRRTWWGSCAGTWTGCRWRWSSPRRGCGSCRSPRSRVASDDRFALLRGGRPRHPATAPHAAGRRRLELEPARSAGAGRAAGAVGVPGRILRGRRGARTRRGGALDVLEHLVDQSLLKVTDTPAGVRFRMLETVREFSAARCEVAGVSDRVAVAFLTWARDFGLARLRRRPSALTRTPWPTRSRPSRTTSCTRCGSRWRGTTAPPWSRRVPPSRACGWSSPSTRRLLTLGVETDWSLSHYRPEPEMRRGHPDGRGARRRRCLRA